MTKEEFKTVLEKTKIPVYWHHADKGVPTPVIVYFSNKTQNISADSIAYIKIPIYSVAIYTTDTDGEKETALLEAVFDEANIFYDKVTEYDEQDRIWLTLYENILL